MLKSFEPRRDGGLLIALVVAAALAVNAATHRAEAAGDVASGPTPAPESAAEVVSPAIDYFNAVGQATAAAEP